MVSYVSNLVELVGLGLAIDYSLLVVYRFREELGASRDVDGAIVRTMETAGRSVLFSGATVGIGLGLLLFVPVPFVRSLGVGGFLVPLLSMAAAATLQPALLSVLGVRGMRRIELLPAARDLDRGFWSRLARAIMRRPRRFLAVGAAILVAAAIPAAWLQVTPGSISALPTGNDSSRGIQLLRDRVGAGALTPIEDRDRHGPGPRRRHAAVPARGATARRRRRSTTGRRTSSRAASRRRTSTRAGSSHACTWSAATSTAPSRASISCERLRDDYVPRARFPHGDRVYVGGAPAQGVDYLSRSYAWFPWLVAAALLLTYLVLMRAFRSVLLPLKAVLLNVLSVAAVYGLLVVIFRWGVGADLLGLVKVDQIEGWIPIFLFAMLFGLSMDYEVFLVTRMREAWDRTHDNAQRRRGRPRAHRPHRHGRRADHGRRVLGLRRRPRRRPAGVRRRPRARDPHRRDARADDPRAVADGDLRPLELVAAEERGPKPPLLLHTIYLTIVIAKRIAGSSYPSARPGTSCAYVRTGIIPYGVFANDGCCV